MVAGVHVSSGVRVRGNVGGFINVIVGGMDMGVCDANLDACTIPSQYEASNQAGERERESKRINVVSTRILGKLSTMRICCIT